jgi:peptide methionine sulfoxide reductase MsrB
MASKRTKKTRLEVVCAWCGKHMGWKDGKGETGITHSICQKCYKKELKV